MTATILRGDALHLPLADESVDCVVTSPPYFGLRSYTDGGAHYDGQLGSEPTPAEFVDALLAATREMVRVTKPSGSIWVNLGDKYASSGGHGAGATSQRADRSQYIEQIGRGEANRTGYPSKTLLGIPWRYALACIDRLGLILRAEIIWSKPNGLPESVTDRVRRSHEQWFHMVRQPRYYSAVDEVREAQVSPIQPTKSGASVHRSIGRVGPDDPRDLTRPTFPVMDEPNPLGKLPGSVWTVPTEPLTVPPELGVDHFAAFPTEWPRRIIAGWSPPGICTACGEGRRPDVASVNHMQRRHQPHRVGLADRHAADGREGDRKIQIATITGYVCACTPYTDHPGTGDWREAREVMPEHGSVDWSSHGNAPRRPGNFNNQPKSGPWREYHHDRWTPPPTRPAIVLDPFGGTGTVALVADILGRHGISVDLSADYCRLARWRTTDPGQRARAARVDKPPPVTDGQLDLFTPAKGAATMTVTRPMKGDWEDDWDIVENGLVPELTKTARLLLPGAPVEWAGELHDGRHWYFRARHEQCGLGVGATEDEAIDNQRADHDVPGGEFSASYLSPTDTLTWLRRLLSEVRP